MRCSKRNGKTMKNPWDFSQKSRDSIDFSWFFSPKKLQVRTHELIFPEAPEGLGPPTMLGCADLRSATDWAEKWKNEWR
jgi:hypothetical protein